MESSNPCIPLIHLTRHRQDAYCRVGMILVALCVLGTMFASSVARAQGSHGKIAFVSNLNDGFWHINVMNTDGSSLTDLHNAGLSLSPFNDGYPSFNRIGTQIAFISDRAGSWDVYTMNADGTNQRRVTVMGAPYLLYPHFSPDGKKIAFMADRAGNGDREIYIVNADGSGLAQLTSNPVPNGSYGPVFTPDGSKIVFNRFNSIESPSYDLMEMNVDGTQQTLIVHEAGDGGSPSISPDGARIAFVGVDVVGTYPGLDISVMSANGTGQTILTGGASNNVDPCFSPDGNQIVFTSDRSRPSQPNASGDNELWMMNADGTNLVQLTFSTPIAPNWGSTNFSPAWGPGTVGRPAILSVSLNPTSVIGGNSSQGMVTLSGPAPAGGAVIALASNSSSTSVPPSVAIPAGATSATFTATTGAVIATTSVTVSAAYDGLTQTAALTVQPVAPADTVAITKAEYSISHQQLQVEATSTNASTTLNVYATSTGALIGTLTNSGGGKYKGQFSWPTYPQNVTVKSSSGGTASSAVKQDS